MTTKSVTSAAALLGAASLVSRLVGIFRDRMLSGTFGAGPELDAYYAAFRAPDLLYNLLVLGAVSAGFIPVFTHYLNRGDRDKEGAWELASRLISVIGAGLCVLSLAGIIFAPFIVPLLVPGFDAEQTRLTVTLTRIMFLSPVFLGLSSVYGGILQTFRRFLVYALAPILYNAGIIFGVAAFSGTMGVTGAAVGVALGAFLHLVVQFVACRSAGMRFSFLWDMSHKGLREIGRMMVPRTAALAIVQVNLVIITVIASTLGSGGISVFNLANNLQSFPIGILGVSFAIAAFPLISELADQDRKKEFVDTISKTTRTILYMIIPATIAFLLLRAQIVRVILGTGRFDWADTIATADTLAFFTLSLFAQALLPLIARAFFALQDVRTPLITGLAAVVFERLLAWQLVRAGMGIPGLALAFSIGSTLNIALLWLFLRMRVGSMREMRIFRSLVPMCTAGLAMAFFMQASKIAVAGFVDMRTFAGVFTQGLTAGLVGIVIYIGVTLSMGSEEAQYMIKLFRKKFRKGVEPVTVRNEDVVGV